MNLREVWQQDRPAFGAWSVLGAPFSAELLALAGFDYVCIDCQHGLTGYDRLVPALQAVARTNAAALVRVPANDFATIGKALDAGADGVIVPMVNSPSEAQAAVEACRYPPEGIRSFGPVRAGVIGVRAPVCIAMIETRRALEDAPSICRTPGLDGIYIGPMDLALSIGVGLAGAFRNPAHIEAISAIRDACVAGGVVAGIHTMSGEQGRSFADQGFRLVTIASDSALVQSGASRALRAARGEQSADAPRSAY